MTMMTIIMMMLLKNDNDNDTDDMIVVHVIFIMLITMSMKILSMIIMMVTKTSGLSSAQCVRYIVLCTRIKVHRYHSIIFSIVFSSSQQ
jgi:hypothetical protein